MRLKTKPPVLAFLLTAVHLFTSAELARGALSDCLDATCRVSTATGAMGSGCCFHYEDQRFFVITAAHVVESVPTVTCEFWRRGHLSSPIRSSVVWRSSASDLAVIAVPEIAFKGTFPAVVPLAAPGTRMRPGDTIQSVGCPHGKWATAWKGHFLGYEQGDLIFRPPPAEGRSGSAVFDARGQRIVAIVRARRDREGVGIATSVFPPPATGDPNGTSLATQYCPDGICDLPKPFGKILQNDTWRPSPEQPAWPTLPNRAAEPDDLRSANQKLDEISSLLKQLVAANQATLNEPGKIATPPLQPIPPQASGSMTETDERQLGKLKEDVTSMRRLIETVAGDMETIPDRFAARLEKVKSDETDSTAQIARAYARDYLAEKTEGGELGWSAGKMLSGALGLSGPLGLGLALGMWFLSRRVGRKLDSGESLLVERLGERLSEKLDRLKDRIEVKQ